MALARSGAVRRSASCVRVLKIHARGLKAAHIIRVPLVVPWWFLGGLPLGLTIASELDSRRWERITLRAVSFDVAMVGKVKNIGCTVKRPWLLLR